MTRPTWEVHVEDAGTLDMTSEDLDVSVVDGAITGIQFHKPLTPSKVSEAIVSVRREVAKSRKLSDMFDY